MENKKIRISRAVIPVMIISALIAASCDAAATEAPAVLALPPATSSPFPSAEPSPTTDPEIYNLRVFCADNTVPEGGNVTAAVQEILNKQGNEIGFHSTVELSNVTDWFIGVGLNGLAVTQPAKDALVTLNDVAPGSKVCLSKSDGALRNNLVPPTPEPIGPGGSILPPQGRIFANVQRGFSPSKGV